MQLQSTKPPVAGQHSGLWNLFAVYSACNRSASHEWRFAAVCRTSHAGWYLQDLPPGTWLRWLVLGALSTQIGFECPNLEPPAIPTRSTHALSTDCPRSSMGAQVWASSYGFSCVIGVPAPSPVLLSAFSGLALDLFTLSDDHSIIKWSCCCALVMRMLHLPLSVVASIIVYEHSATVPESFLQISSQAKWHMFYPQARGGTACVFFALRKTSSLISGFWIKNTPVGNSHPEMLWLLLHLLLLHLLLPHKTCVLNP